MKVARPDNREATLDLITVSAITLLSMPRDWVLTLFVIQSGEPKNDKRALPV